MSIPSSQIAASWIKTFLVGDDWASLRSVAHRAVLQYWKGHSDEEVWEYVEENVGYIAEHLRNEVAQSLVDGCVIDFEIDNEEDAYIKALNAYPKELLQKLRRIDPFEFEDVCAKLLNALGGKSEVTQKTSDGGIDFISTQLSIVPLRLRAPVACSAVVIGQAKRYKDGAAISETRVREFVGAAMLRKHQLHTNHNISPLAPVLFAFWTTSSFDGHAKKFAKQLGLWFLDGPTLAAYVYDLHLQEYVLGLPDALA